MIINEQKVMLINLADTRSLQLPEIGYLTFLNHKKKFCKLASYFFLNVERLNTFWFDTHTGLW